MVRRFPETSFQASTLTGASPGDVIIHTGRVLRSRYRRVLTVFQEADHSRTGMVSSRVFRKTLFEELDLFPADVEALYERCPVIVRGEHRNNPLSLSPSGQVLYLDWINSMLSLERGERGERASSAQIAAADAEWSTLGDLCDRVKSKQEGVEDGWRDYVSPTHPTRRDFFGGGVFFGVDVVCDPEGSGHNRRHYHSEGSVEKAEGLPSVSIGDHGQESARNEALERENVEMFLELEEMKLETVKTVVDKVPVEWARKGIVDAHEQREKMRRELYASRVLGQEVEREDIQSFNDDLAGGGLRHYSHQPQSKLEILERKRERLLEERRRMDMRLIELDASIASKLPLDIGAGDNAWEVDSRFLSDDVHEGVTADDNPNEHAARGVDLHPSPSPSRTATAFSESSYVRTSPTRSLLGEDRTGTTMTPVVWRHQQITRPFPTTPIDKEYTSQRRALEAELEELRKIENEMKSEDKARLASTRAGLLKEKDEIERVHRNSSGSKSKSPLAELKEMLKGSRERKSAALNAYKESSIVNVNGDRNFSPRTSLGITSQKLPLPARNLSELEEWVNGEERKLEIERRRQSLSEDNEVESWFNRGPFDSFDSEAQAPEPRLDSVRTPRLRDQMFGVSTGGRPVGEAGVAERSDKISRDIPQLN